MIATTTWPAGEQSNIVVMSWQSSRRHERTPPAGGSTRQTDWQTCGRPPSCRQLQATPACSPASSLITSLSLGSTTVTVVARQPASQQASKVTMTLARPIIKATLFTCALACSVSILLVLPHFHFVFVVVVVVVHRSSARGTIYTDTTTCCCCCQCYSPERQTSEPLALAISHTQRPPFDTTLNLDIIQLYHMT